MTPALSSFLGFVIGKVAVGYLSWKLYLADQDFCLGVLKTATPQRSLDIARSAALKVEWREKVISERTESIQRYEQARTVKSDAANC